MVRTIDVEQFFELLNVNGGNIMRTCRELGISESWLNKKKSDEEFKARLDSRVRKPQPRNIKRIDVDTFLEAVKINGGNIAQTLRLLNISIAWYNVLCEKDKSLLIKIKKIKADMKQKTVELKDVLYKEDTI